MPRVTTRFDHIFCVKTHTRTFTGIPYQADSGLVDHKDESEVCLRTSMGSSRLKIAVHSV